MNRTLFDKFETSNSEVTIFKTDIVIDNEDLYIIVSKNKFSGQEYTRFGNYTQMRSIQNTYKTIKRYFSL